MENIMKYYFHQNCTVDENTGISYLTLPQYMKALSQYLNEQNKVAIETIDPIVKTQNEFITLIVSQISKYPDLSHIETNYIMANLLSNYPYFVYESINNIINNKPDKTKKYKIGAIRNVDVYVDPNLPMDQTTIHYYNNDDLKIHVQLYKIDPLFAI